MRLPEAMRLAEAMRPCETMTKRASTFQVVVVVCAFAIANLAVPTSAAAQGPADLALKARIEAVLVSASDIPADSITVAVSEGVVTLSGSVVCAECGGRRTPNGSGTVQQSLGAVVRAIPGVERVEFKLRYRPQE